jgi:hypothetical protein
VTVGGGYIVRADGKIQHPHFGQGNESALRKLVQALQAR